MAFVCTANLDRSSFEIILNTVVIPIGYDDERPGLNYSAVVGFAPMAGTDDVEYFFYIVEAESNEGFATNYWTGTKTKDFIPSAIDRKIILHTVLFWDLQALGSV